MFKKLCNNFDNWMKSESFLVQIIVVLIGGLAVGVPIAFSLMFLTALILSTPNSTFILILFFIALVVCLIYRFVKFVRLNKGD